MRHEKENHASPLINHILQWVPRISYHTSTLYWSLSLQSWWILTKMSTLSSISLGSFTLLDPSSNISVSATTSVVLDLPQSLADVCDPAILVSKVRQGNLYISHSDSCLLHISFQINGTPIASEQSLPRWGSLIANCEVST